jgi:hypothetical protein
MKGSIGKYLKKDGREEVRIHFSVWLLDGVELRDVTVFPHECGTCIGGDHTHVELNDQRTPVEIIAADAFVIDPDSKKAIDNYLRAKLAVNNITDRLIKALSAHVVTKSRGGLFTSLLAQD